MRVLGRQPRARIRRTQTSQRRRHRRRATSYGGIWIYRCTTGRNGVVAPLLLKATPGVTIALIASQSANGGTRTPDGRSSFHRLASVGQGHSGIPGSLRSRRRCVRKRTNRSWDRKTARRNRGLRHRSSLHPEGTPRKPGKGPMMLAAVETVTKADPVWASRRHNSKIAARQPPVNRSMSRLLLNQAMGVFTANPVGRP